MSKTHTTQCPNCYTQIDIDEIFYHKIEEQKKLRDGLDSYDTNRMVR